MTVSKVILGTALAAAVVVGGSFAVSQNGGSLVSVAHADTMAQPVKFSSAENTIKYCQNLMKAIGGHWGAIATTLKEGDSLGAIAIHAEAVAGLAKATPAAFAEGSGPMDGDTKAKAEIWDKKDEFAKVVMAFQAETAKLAKIAASGDKGAIAAQFGEVGKVGCKGCHSEFKSK